MALFGLAWARSEPACATTWRSFRSDNCYSRLSGSRGHRRPAAPIRCAHGWPRCPWHARAGNFGRPSCAPCTSTARPRKQFPTCGFPQQARLRIRRRSQDRVTVADVGRLPVGFCQPLHLLYCCPRDTDNATALIVTSAELALDLRRQSGLLRGVAGPGHSAADRLPLGARSDHTRVGLLPTPRTIVFRAERYQPTDVNHRLLRPRSPSPPCSSSIIRLLNKARAASTSRAGVIDARCQAAPTKPSGATSRRANPLDLDGDRERAPAPRPVDDYLPGLVDATQLRLLACHCPPGEGRARHHESRLGDAAVPSPPSS